MAGARGKAEPRLEKGSLSFKPIGKILSPNELEDEFAIMGQACKGRATPEKLHEIARKSGTHLLKLIAAQADGDQPVLRIESRKGNLRPALLPSVNAPDIPIAKLIFRPLEIADHATRSVADHIRNPDDLSSRVLDAFASVFGQDALDALRSGLLDKVKPVTALPAGEFPIIFVPRPGGGDLQVSPVSPAESFMGFKAMAAAWFLKQEKDGPRVPRGRWDKQDVSSKPQNISGAIGGPRMRFLAEMPAVLEQAEAEIHRFIMGGQFPRWRNPEIADRMLRYADLLENDYQNKAIRDGTSRLIDWIIHEALDFRDEVLDEAMRLAAELGLEASGSAPRPATIILRRYWPKGSFDRARRTLASDHFALREKNILLERGPA